LADSGLEHTFIMIMRFVNLKVTLVQRLMEFTEEISASSKFVDTYQVDASDSESSEVVEQVEIAKLEFKQIKFSKSHPPAQNKVNLTLRYDSVT
jgi:hypothetical protein